MQTTKPTYLVVMDVDPDDANAQGHILAQWGDLTLNEARDLLSRGTSITVYITRDLEEAHIRSASLNRVGCKATVVEET